MDTILLVEDDPFQAVLIRSILQVMGCEIVWADNSQAAVAITQQVRPAVVLMDLVLPTAADGLGGLAATAVIRADPEIAHTPVVAVSAYTSHEVMWRAEQVGCDEFIAKPFEAAYLRRCVQAFLPGGTGDTE